MAATMKCPAGKTVNSQGVCTLNFKAKRKQQGLLLPAVQAARRSADLHPADSATDVVLSGVANVKQVERVCVYARRHDQVRPRL